MTIYFKVRGSLETPVLRWNMRKWLNIDVFLRYITKIPLLLCKLYRFHHLLCISRYWHHINAPWPFASIFRAAGKHSFCAEIWENGWKEKFSCDILPKYVSGYVNCLDSCINYAYQDNGRTEKPHDHLFLNPVLLSNTVFCTEMWETHWKVKFSWNILTKYFSVM